jgi:hypothetical protein
MEPISIAAGTLGAEFLKEGIKFLWSEAGKIMDRYHKKDEKDAAIVTGSAPAPLGLPERRTLDFAVVGRSIDALRAEIRSLALYVNGADPIAVTDVELLAHADALQRLVVQAYGIHAPELSAAGHVGVDVVETGGQAIGVAARAQRGTFTGTVDAGTVRGTAIGAKIDTD